MCIWNATSSEIPSLTPTFFNLKSTFLPSQVPCFLRSKGVMFPFYSNTDRSFFVCFLFWVLGIKLRLSHMLCKPFTTELYLPTSHQSGFFLCVCVLQYWDLNSGPTLRATPPALFYEGFFWDRVSRTICLGWLQTFSPDLCLLSS
jgi:hypothetical protein